MHSLLPKPLHLGPLSHYMTFMRSLLSWHLIKRLTSSFYTDGEDMEDRPVSLNKHIFTLVKKYCLKIGHSFCNQTVVSPSH